MAVWKWNGPKITVGSVLPQSWLRGCFDRLRPGCLEVHWVLDIDVTVKPIYGKQEGAELGYNPAKPCRPSHAYHSFWVGHLRLCLGVQVRPGNETAGSFGLPLLREWLERIPKTQWPEFVRGDIGRNLEAAAERLINWAWLIAEQLKSASVWKRIIAHILQYHHTIGAGKTRHATSI